MKDSKVGPGLFRVEYAAETRAFSVTRQDIQRLRKGENILPEQPSPEAPPEIRFAFRLDEAMFGNPLALFSVVAGAFVLWAVYVLPSTAFSLFLSGVSLALIGYGWYGYARWVPCKLRLDEAREAAARSAEGLPAVVTRKGTPLCLCTRCSAFWISAAAGAIVATGLVRSSSVRFDSTQDAIAILVATTIILLTTLHGAERRLEFYWRQRGESRGGGHLVSIFRQSERLVLVTGVLMALASLLIALVLTT